MFFLIDKPLGMTSFDVIRILRKKLNQKKMGHIGTLDPLATWLLLIGTENSTKLFPFLEGKCKTYFFRVRIDGMTRSLDLWEDIIPVSTEKIKIPSPEFFEKNLLALEEQIPPLYSALHIDGKRAYELAREWSDIILPKRPIHISHAEFLGRDGYELSFRVTISSGGYIRSLAPVIGEWSGNTGGYITELRREMIHLEHGELSLDMSTALDDITPFHEISLETLFPHWEFLNIDDATLEQDIKNGKSFTIPNQEKKLEWTHFFVTFPDNYRSLVQKTENGYTIVKNNV